MVLGIIILLSLAGISFAGDSHTISVSCTIPEIPGVNAPAVVEEKTVKIDTSIPAQQEVETQEETKKHAVIQEETEKEVLMAKQQNSSVVVQTIYSR